MFKEKFSIQKFKTELKNIDEGSVDKPEDVKAETKEKSASFNKETIKPYSEEERKEMESKRKVLSALAHFIGKDFKLPVEFNRPGAGWHWDFKHNIIRIDPEDLILERFNAKRKKQGLKPLTYSEHLDYLRFVISHEGSHRRISRADFIPKEEWREHGFSTLMNVIEDPRVNNYIADNYADVEKELLVAYDWFQEESVKDKDKYKETLGFQPRFMLAGFEYIKQWFRERFGLACHITEDLPDEVKDVVSKTLKYAQESWWSYPSKEEVDDEEMGEEYIRDYAEYSYKINREKIWPEFKKLVEKDREDAVISQLLSDMLEENEAQEGQGSGEGSSKDIQIPEDLANKLSEKELEELKKSLEDAKKNGKKNVDVNKLSQELKDKLKEYIDKLKSENKKNLEEKINKKIKEIEKDLRKAMTGQNIDGFKGENEENGNEDANENENSNNVSGSQEDENNRGYNKSVENGVTDSNSEGGKGVGNEKSTSRNNRELDEEKSKDESKDNKEEEDGSKTKEKSSNIFDKDTMQKIEDEVKKIVDSLETAYGAYRRELLPLINELEFYIRKLFHDKRKRKVKTGFKTGSKIKISKRMQERARGVLAVDSKAWIRIEKPKKPEDYAISLVVDLSGSMEGLNIQESFKAIIVLAEVFSRLSIKFNVIGFDTSVYEFKDFNEKMNNKLRDRLMEILFTGGGGTDNYRALQYIYDKIQHLKEKNKIIIVLTDGMSGNEDLLDPLIKHMSTKDKYKLIGLGLGEGTEAVVSHYPVSIADINVVELPKILADLLKVVLDS